MPFRYGSAGLASTLVAQARRASKWRQRRSAEGAGAYSSTQHPLRTRRAAGQTDETKEVEFVTPRGEIPGFSKTVPETR